MVKDDNSSSEITCHIDAGKEENAFFSHVFLYCEVFVEKNNLAFPGP